MTEPQPAAEVSPGKPPRPAAGLSRPERRDRDWLKSYDTVSHRIAEALSPRTVLDAGCSMGLLVEGLRRRGIDAAGIDPDPADFAQADPAIRPYLSQAAFTEPFPGRYDLVVCLTGLAGAAPAALSAALVNFSHHTDLILLAGADPAQAAEILAGEAFFRDPDFAAAFISPSAALFRRRVDFGPQQIVAVYEGRYQALYSENVALREQTAETAQALSRLQIEYDTVSKTLSSRLRQWESIWADVERSAGWKFIHRVRVLRLRLAPPGSRRAALLRIARESWGVLRSTGIGAFFRHWARGLRSNEFRFAPGQKTIEQRNAEAYPDFVARTTRSAEELASQRERSRSWLNRPLVSFITPVYRPPVEVLRATIESARAQSYEHWELCLADASPDSPEIRALLEDYAGRDERIRVSFLPQNLGICGNSNAALGMARGEYVAILDHDDVLAPQMLFEVVRRIQENHFADLLYFDEDKLSEDGAVRRDPFFKPDFSPDMLLSANYLTHAVYRRALVEAVGGFDLAFEGTQDWDLAFKVTERTRQVEHIPEILYHWRQVSGSTAGDFGAKSYVFERQLQAVTDHLHRSGLKEAAASFPVPGFLRAVWPASGRKVSIIIPTKDKVDYLQRTITTLRERTVYPDYEIIIVDNQSAKPQTLKYFDQLRQTPGVRIIDYHQPFNYSQANNVGAAQASGEILLFLNNDVEILEPDWLTEMVRWADRPEIGVAGAKLLYPDDTIQHAGVIVGMEGHASHVFYGYRERQSGPFGSVDWYRNFTAITGACMMLRREVFEEIGRFDEKYLLAFSDIELCMRAIDHGYRVVYTPHARLHHFEGKSRGDHIPSNDIRVGIDDFMPLVERGDPYYNPNLSYVERKPLIRPADEEDRVSRLLRVAAGARVNDLTR